MTEIRDLVISNFERFFMLMSTLFDNLCTEMILNRERFVFLMILTILLGTAVSNAVNLKSPNNRIMGTVETIKEKKCYFMISH